MINPQPHRLLPRSRPSASFALLIGVEGALRPLLSFLAPFFFIVFDTHEPRDDAAA